MTPAELGPIKEFNPHQHDPDDVVSTAIVDGIQGSVYRPVAEAPYAIGVGVVELHQYAGVSGGHKAVAVGCGGRQTIAALHDRSRVLCSGVRIGSIDQNPFRQTIDELGRAAGCRLALVWVPAADCWLFGSPEGVVQEGLRRLDPWIQVDSLADGAVLHVPPSKASSLYQASRAATYLSESPHPPLNPGATLVLRAHCSEGLGTEAGFVAALKRSSPPWSELLVGPPPTGAGAQRAVMLAKLAARYRLRIEGCTDPSVFGAVGIEATREVSPVSPTWLQVDRPFHQLPQFVRSRSSSPKS
jgi:hypothetical protein